MNPSEKWQENLRPRLLVAQIVVAALTMGCLIFLGIALGVMGMPENVFGPFQIITLGISAVVLVARVVYLKINIAQGRKKIAAGREASSKAPRSSSYGEIFSSEPKTLDAFCTLFLNKTIMGTAPIEGICFLSLVLYFVQPSYVNLAAAVLLLALIPMLNFPTSNGMVQWLEDQARQMQEEELLQGGK